MRTEAFTALILTTYFCLRCGADKSLARPGKKQTTAIKLGIYSTHSPRSSIHYLARCSNLLQATQKEFIKLSLQPGLRGSNDLRVGRKMSKFPLFFSVQGTGCSLTGPDPEKSVGDEDTGSPGRPVSSGLQMPCESGHCRARTRPSLLTFPRFAFFPSKCPSISPAEMSKYSPLIVWALCEIIN